MVAVLETPRTRTRQSRPVSYTHLDVYKRQLVGAIMSSPVHAVRPDQSVEECMALMTEKRVRHLPVLEHGKLIGMISQGDLVKFIIEDQRFIIGQLESYIAR